MTTVAVPLSEPIDPFLLLMAEVRWKLREAARESGCLAEYDALVCEPGVRRVLVSWRLADGSAYRGIVCADVRGGTARRAW